jgi:hypothetical protein
MLKQLAQVLNERTGSRAIGEIARIAETAMIEGDAAVMLRKFGQLLPPAQMVPAAPVSENQRRSFAVSLVVEIDSVDFSRWHARDLLQS